MLCCREDKDASDTKYRRSRGEYEVYNETYTRSGCSFQGMYVRLSVTEGQASLQYLLKFLKLCYKVYLRYH